jgi:hypothetical protein
VNTHRTPFGACQGPKEDASPARCLQRNRSCVTRENVVLLPSACCRSRSILAELKLSLPMSLCGLLPQPLARPCPLNAREKPIWPGEHPVATTRWRWKIGIRLGLGLGLGEGGSMDGRQRVGPLVEPHACPACGCQLSERNQCGYRLGTCLAMNLGGDWRLQIVATAEERASGCGCGQRRLVVEVVGRDPGGGTKCCRCKLRCQRQPLNPMAQH